jgi:hypothetical protein
MKLIPFLRFGNGRGKEEESETIDSLPDELLEPPTDEETEQAEDEEKPEEEEQAKEEEDGGAPMGNDEEMLKVFITVEEEFVDNSGLASQIEDVPAAELLQELRVLASAFGIRVEATQDEAV